MPWILLATLKSLLLLPVLVALTSFATPIWLPLKTKPTTQSTMQPVAQLQLDFRAWKVTQKPKTLNDYHAFIAGHLKPAPPLLDMTYNRHRPKNDCKYIQFLIPPRDLWPSLKPALRLLGLLQQQGLATTYQIRSVYRDPSANACIGGARGSRHVQHAALDFRVLSVEATPTAYQQLDQQYCDFWRTHGRKYNMGLGVYGRGRYHVDGTGYRTWGSDYKRATSPC